MSVQVRVPGSGESDSLINVKVGSGDVQKDIAQFISSTETITGDQAEVVSLARRVLNNTSKKRMISKQEAFCHLANLRLCDCSENIVRVSISGAKKMGTDKEAKNSFLTKYRDRKDHLDMNMDDYFNYYYNDRYPDKNRKTFVPF